MLQHLGKCLHVGSADVLVMPAVLSIGEQYLQQHLCNSQGWCGKSDRYCGAGRCYSGACKSTQPTPSPKCAEQLLLRTCNGHSAHGDLLFPLLH